MGELSMRIAILGTRGIPAHYGGFETFAEQLATRLAAKKVDVTVFCPCKSAKAPEIYQGVTLRFVRYPPESKFSEVIWDVKCFWEARHGFDVVYMLGVGASFAALIPRFWGSEVWINSDGLEWKRAKWSCFQRLYLALAEFLSVLFASRIIADAPPIAEYLHRRYPGLRHISTIAYGAEIPAMEPSPDLLAEWGLQPRCYFVVVCRLEPENHVLEIIEGFLCANASVPLVILGNVKNPNSYVRSLLAFQSERIRFLGTIYDKQKLEALRFYAKGYFHGHSVGGTNPSLLEAMACSNLVIAHDNAFNRDVLENSGLFFKSPSELAAIVENIENNLVDADVLRSRGQEIIARRFSWDFIANGYFQLLESAINR